MKSETLIQFLRRFCDTQCDCGKIHDFCIDDIIVEKGAINRVAEVVFRYHVKKAFVLADKNTYAVAGKQICDGLSKANIAVSKYVFNVDALEPDECAVGSATMGFDSSCDMIVAVGSGVINDIGKILANTSKKPYLIFGTAPSMDGYASATSSMSIGGLKVSLPSKQANVIMTDTEVLAKAPLNLLQAGIGDMLAKYLAICEWKIARLVVGEYYCSRIADMVMSSLEKCVSNLDGLIRRDEQAVANVFEGLVLCGVGMSLAGCSRPASGVEHYYSHIWDMRGLSKGTPVALHGIQCAIGTRLAIQKYEQLKAISPNREKALAHANHFDFATWSETLRDFIGAGAEQMIAQEKKEGKYDKERHAKRLDVILEHWNELLEIMDTVPSESKIVSILDRLNAPKSIEDIGLSEDILPLTFQATKDIRDKYVLSRLYWDLGIQ
ncbi:MAG: sn-glycerol-1-phosphate dehydrogenase [Clostridia bacterium]|nr:sn-glycerol-1-phosphate dehydrogenase [Clostridia bacterium]